MNEKKASFLAELETLCQKYNAAIMGCGCCGSPILEIDGETVETELNVGESVSSSSAPNTPDAMIKAYQDSDALFARQ